MGFGNYVLSGPGEYYIPQGVNVGPPISYEQQRLDALTEQLAQQISIISEQKNRIDCLERELKNYQNNQFYNK